MRRYVMPKVSDNSGRGKVIDTCIAQISKPSSLDVNACNGFSPEPVRGSRYSPPHAHGGSSSEASCSRLCCQTGTPHSCVIVKRLKIHFDLAGLYTCLYSTGVRSTLWVIFQVEDSTTRGDRAGSTNPVMPELYYPSFSCASSTESPWGKKRHRNFSSTHGIEHRKQLGYERSAVRNSYFGTALDILIVGLNFGRPVLRNFTAKDLGGGQRFTSNDEHRIL